MLPESFEVKPEELLEWAREFRNIARGQDLDNRDELARKYYSGAIAFEQLYLTVERKMLERATVASCEKAFRHHPSLYNLCFWPDEHYR